MKTADLVTVFHFSEFASGSDLPVDSTYKATRETIVDALPLLKPGDTVLVPGQQESYTGSMGVSAIGLVPATRTSNTVAGGATQCVNTAIPAGATIARFQLFNADTQGGSATDLDLDVFNGPGGTGTRVGTSGGSSSDEVVTLKNPPAGTYSACVTGFSVPAGGALYTLSSWVVGPAAGVQTYV